MNHNLHAAGALGSARQQHAAELSVLVARINAQPEEVTPVTDAFLRVLEISASCPGGQQALISELVRCTQANEVLAFCRMYTAIATIEAGGAAHPHGVINPIHDLGGEQN